MCFIFIRRISMFDTFAEVEKYLESQGIKKGDPLNQSLENARHAQHLYLKCLNGEPVSRSTTKFLNLHGAAGHVQFSITYPVQSESTVPIIYIRGGGWWNGSLELSSRLVQDIADAARMPVVCVDFGLAPQTQFPTQIDQICMVIEWLTKSGSQFQLDSDRCVLWGDSAGGSLALCVTNKLDQIYPQFFAGHVLFYGNFNGPTEVTTPYSQWVWSNYLGQAESSQRKQAVPLQNTLRGVQRAWLAAGSKDPLLHDSQLLQQALRHQSIACDLEIVDNLPHGFLSYSRLLKPAQTALLKGARMALEFSRSVEQVEAK